MTCPGVTDEGPATDTVGAAGGLTVTFRVVDVTGEVWALSPVALPAKVPTSSTPVVAVQSTVTWAPTAKPPGVPAHAGAGGSEMVTPVRGMFPALVAVT